MRREHSSAGAFLKLGALAIAAVYTGCLAVAIGKYCYFAGDDFRGFITAGSFSFGRALLVPIGSQVAPLHRIVNLAHFHAARMNFHVAVAILLLFHALGVVYLYRILQSFKDTALNVVIVSWYCAYAHLGLTIDWWSSGLQRCPYVAFSLVSVFHYLRYCRAAKSGDLSLTILFFLAALGFYGKTVTIALVFIALDILDGINRGRSRLFDKAFLYRAGICAALGLIALLYVPGARALGGGTVKESLGLLDPAFQLKFQLMAFTVASHSVFGIVLALLSYHPKLWVGVVWLLAVSYSIYRARRAAVAWLALALLLATNFLMLAISSRTSAFGLTVACELRYFYELAFLFALFIGLVIHAQPADSPEARWFRRAGQGWVASSTLLTALALHAVVSFRSMSEIRSLQSRDIPQVRQYVDRLKAGYSTVRAEHREQPRFIDGQLPIYITGMDFAFTRHSQLFELLQLDAQFDEKDRAQFRVSTTGDVERISL